MPSPTQRVVVPGSLIEWHDKFFGPVGRIWLDAVPELAEELLSRWTLTLDGPSMCGAVALVVPVLLADGTPAVLKLQPIDDETAGEPIALRAWQGSGVVDLLKHDPASGTMLLARLDATRSLRSIPSDLEALEILSELLGRLTSVPAPTQPAPTETTPIALRQLSDLAANMLERVPNALARLNSSPRARQVSRCADIVSDLLPDCGDRLLHGDLHFGNVLASTGPEPWLVIDPKPVAGDPGFDILAALHNRWDDVTATGDVAKAVKRRFDLMTSVAGLDRQCATGWTLAKILQNILWEVEHEDTMWHTDPDNAIANVLLATL